MVTRETFLGWFAAAIQPVKDRLAMMVARGVLLALEQGVGLMRATVDGVAGETLGEREYVLDYGLSSRPLPGAEVLALFLAGLRSNGMVVRIFDRRYQIQLAPGEVAIHDDLGQRVHLTRAGIVADTPLDITFRAGGKFRVECETYELHATVSASWDVDGYGRRITSLGAGAYEDKTWQIGAVITSVPLPIAPPEGPGDD